MITEFGLIAYVSSGGTRKRGHPLWRANSPPAAFPDQHIKSRSVCSLRWVQTIGDRSGRPGSSGCRSTWNPKRSSANPRKFP